MQRIPASDAKARLAEVLRAVERGDSYVVTRHGREIARIVPPPSDADQRRAAIARFRARRQSWAPARMSLQDILDARHEGHRA